MHLWKIQMRKIHLEKRTNFHLTAGSFMFVKIRIHVTIRNLSVPTLYFIIEPDTKHSSRINYNFQLLKLNLQDYN